MSLRRRYSQIFFRVDNTIQERTGFGFRKTGF